MRLVKGEALFEVAKNAERPFLVNAAASTVRAVGTRFSVRLQQDNVEVVVSEGKVIVTRSIAEPGASGSDKEVSVLVQKQAVTINEHLTEPVTIQTVDTEELGRRLSWTTGMLEFDGEPLERVVEEVGRYTPLTITIADPDLRQIRVGGRFRVGETKALFDVIEAGFGAKVTYQGNGVVITSN